MSLSPEVQERIGPYLRHLESGFGAIERIGDRYAVRMAKEGRFRLRAGAKTLFLRLAPANPGERPVVVFRGAQGKELLRAALSAPESWITVPCEGESAADFEVQGGAALLCDLEVLDQVLRATFDLEAAAARKERFLTVRMDLTNKCNLRCRMCSLSFDEVFYQKKDFMPVADFEAFAKEVLPRCSHLSLSAGYEPLLHPEFGTMLGIIAAHGVPYVDFTTNGTLITPDLMESLIRNGVSTVTFSIDGAKAETYQHIRRGARFDRFLAGLELFDRMKRERGVDHPALSFNMVLMRSNIDELADVIRLGARYRLRLMHTSLLVPHTGLRLEAEALQHDRAHANAAFAEAREVAASLGIEAFIPPDFDLTLPDMPVETLDEFSGLTLCEEWMGERSGTEWELESPPGAPIEDLRPASPVPPPVVEPPKTSEPGLAAPAPIPAGASGPSQDDDRFMIRPGSAAREAAAKDGDGTPVDAGCSYPWTMAVLRPDGSVVPCCHWIDPTVMGRLPEQSFEEVWNGAAFHQLRLELLTHRYRPTCAVCPERRRI